MDGTTDYTEDDCYATIPVRGGPTASRSVQSGGGAKVSKEKTFSEADMLCSNVGCGRCRTLEL